MHSAWIRDWTFVFCFLYRWGEENWERWLMIGTPEKVRLNFFITKSPDLAKLHELKFIVFLFIFRIPVCCLLQPDTSFHHVALKVSLNYVFLCIVSPATGIVMTSHFCRLPIRQNGGETVTNWIDIAIWANQVATCLRILSKRGCFFSSASLDVGLRSADAQESVLSGGGEFLVPFHGIEFYISANSCFFWANISLMTVKNGSLCWAKSHSWNCDEFTIFAVYPSDNILVRIVSTELPATTSFVHGRLYYCPKNAEEMLT